MKVKFKVDNQKKLEGDVKGYIINLRTNFGETIGAVVDEEDTELLDKYEIGTVHILDLYAYKGKDNIARLGVRLERKLVEEDF